MNTFRDYAYVILIKNIDAAILLRLFVVAFVEKP